MRSLLVIGYVWPEPDSSAAGARMMQLLQFFISKGYNVTFATTANMSEYAAHLQQEGINCKTIELNNSSFDDFIAALHPDVVIFDRFMMEEQYGWRVSKICPGALKVLDTEDLHCLRDYRGKKLKGYTGTWKGLDITKREIASIFRCDLTLIISEVEMAFLQEEFKVPESLLFYLPFLLNPISSEEISMLPDFEGRENFISIGNFLHLPNSDAVFYLKDKIWPLIRKELPEAKLLLYGAYPNGKIQGLHNPKENFLIKGRAPNAAEVVKKARVSLAALRFGAGLKGKLTEAMQCGTPCVTTSIGAEGINGNLPWPGAIADTPEVFAEKAVELCLNKDIWDQSRKKGFNIINDRFSKQNFLDVFEKKIEELLRELQPHREENFIGAMLTHHRTRSTYFLSKYIEVKNQHLKEKG